MFGKAKPKKDYTEFRATPRYKARGMKATVDDEPVDILDYSEGGMRARTQKKFRKAVIVEIYRRNTLFRRVPAVVAWSSGKEIGFEFRPNLTLYAKEMDTPRKTRASDVVEIPERDEVTVDDPSMNKSGGVAGDALRNRLKL